MDLEESIEGTVAFVNETANIRTAPSTSESEIITEIAKDETITIVAELGNWFKIELGAGEYGYVSGSLIEASRGTATIEGVNTSAIVRDAEGNDTGDRIAKGETVEVLSTVKDGRVLVQTEDVKGYVAAIFVK